MSHQHICGENCPWHLRAAHERSRLSARAKRQAKFKGRHPKTRWLGGHPPPRHWIDEMWGLVEQQ